MPSTFSKVLGQDNININASSEIVWGMKKLELALALDNTGSMASSNKMTELKKAAKTLLTTLKNAAKEPGDVKVAIIPFDTTVRIDTSYNINLWYDIVSALDCNGPSAGLGCTTANWKDAWTGCVRDRTYPYDVQDTPPTSTVSATLYPIDECGSLAVAMPLSTDWTALNNKVDQMTPGGNTNVTIGLVWAWHALTAGVPFTEAAGPSPDLDKVIILLTDGINTEVMEEFKQQQGHKLVGDRHTHGAGLRQHQGSEHQDLCDPRDRWKRHFAAKLRHQSNHVFRRAERVQSQRRVQRDRTEPRQSPHLEIVAGLLATALRQSPHAAPHEMGRACLTARSTACYFGRSVS